MSAGENGMSDKTSQADRSSILVRAVKMVAAVFAAIAFTFTAGCGAARPMQYYQLSVPNDMAQTQPNASGVALALGPLVASHLYREDRIVYGSGGEQMGTYEYQRWTEPPAEMIQEVLLRELRASGRYREVTPQRSSGHTDYVLRGHLYDFKEVSGSPVMARVTAEWELYEVKSGATVWTHHYGHDEPVSGKDVPAVVAALNQNVQKAVGELKAGLDQYFSSVAPKQ